MASLNTILDGVKKILSKNTPLVLTGLTNGLFMDKFYYFSQKLSQYLIYDYEIWYLVSLNTIPHIVIIDFI